MKQKLRIILTSNSLRTLTIVFAALTFVSTQVVAPNALAASLSQDDVDAIYNWPLWNPSLCASGGGTTSSASDTSPTSSTPGLYTLDQIKTFASEPITSTWNISNSTVEQWFLKQAGAQATIAKYGINSSNIGDITAAVQAAGVSPVFFYLYTVNEGGGAGGFINHYTGDTGGGGPGNATRDAKYLVSQSKDKSAGPATDGGEPADMPTAEAKQILDALPLGSIGVAYIQATSAVTAELETLSGKGPVNSQFGMPLSEAMQNIQSMGGNPLQGGTSISLGTCGGGSSSGVAGQGMTKAINWAVMIANNNGYGYDQPTRTSGWAKWQSDPSCATQCGSFDCSSFIAAALTEAGYFKTNPEFSTESEASYLSQAGFKDVTSSVSLDTGANMQPGDILLNTADHTAIYIGNGKLVQASINENGGVSGGQVGDQTGTEIYIRSYYNFPWNSVWRASN